MPRNHFLSLRCLWIFLILSMLSWSLRLYGHIISLSPKFLGKRRGGTFQYGAAVTTAWMSTFTYGGPSRPPPPLHAVHSSAPRTPLPHSASRNITYFKILSNGFPWPPKVIICPLPIFLVVSHMPTSAPINLTPDIRTIWPNGFIAWSVLTPFLLP